MSFQAHLHQVTGFEAVRLDTCSAVDLLDSNNRVVIFGSDHNADRGGSRAEQVARIRHVLDQAYAALDAIDPAKGDQDRYKADAVPFEAQAERSEWKPGDPHGLDYNRYTNLHVCLICGNEFSSESDAEDMPCEGPPSADHSQAGAVT